MQYLRSLDAQLRQEAGRQFQGLDSNQDFTKRLIMGQGGTLIPVYNGDLLLVVQTGGFECPPSSMAPSRPSSSVEGGDKPLARNPSIRVKPGSSQSLDRKASMARRSSLPAVSHFNRQNFVISEPSSDPPLRVFVQAGTLNNLVNILVHGLENISVSVADDNGEMSLREGMTRELVVDRVEFARVWWNVFRSFVTPFVFFEVCTFKTQSFTYTYAFPSSFCARFISLRSPWDRHQLSPTISRRSTNGPKSWSRSRSG
jgi:hypothetical protein